MKIILSVLGLLVCSPVFAAWTAYDQTSTATELFDKATIEKTGTSVRVWAMTNHRAAITNLEGKELLSEKALTTIDCSAKKIGAEVVMTFSGKDTTGVRLGFMETPLRLTPIKPGSSDDALMKVVCR
jgi:hypothetical protein